MTQIFVDDSAVPVTIIEIPKNIVVRRFEEKGTETTCFDIGVGEKRNSSKAEMGKYSGAKKVPQHVWTVCLESEVVKDVKVGSEYGSEVCSIKDTVQVTGVTKAKGFAGVVKRWGFHGGPRTRGQSDRLRAPGSIGGGTDPGRVYPGKKMPGRMGGKTKTIRDRKIVGVGEDYILVKGSLPGNPGGLLKIEVFKHDED